MKSKDSVSARAWVRPRVAAMRGYVPGEQPAGEGFVKLNTNENPYPPSSAVRAAIDRACERLVLYPDPSSADVRRAAAEVYGVDAEGVVVGNGSDELLTILMRAVIEPGQTVAFPVPTYSLYDTLAEIQGATVARVPFGPDFDLPEALQDLDARLLFVCNPNAPSGTSIAIEKLEALACRRTDRLLVVDEAYADFADQDAIGLVGRVPNVVVLRTLSKSYSLAGLRVGLALTSVALARELHKVRDSYNVSRLAQAGAVAALGDQATMRRHVEQVRATRSRLSAELRRLGFSVPESQANFVLARRPGVDLSGLVEALRERRILVRYFPDLADAIRITVGSDEEVDVLLASLRELSR